MDGTLESECFKPCLTTKVIHLLDVKKYLMLHNIRYQEPYYQRKSQNLAIHTLT